MPTISDRRIYQLLTSLYDCAADASTSGFSGVFHELTDLVTAGPSTLAMLSGGADRYSIVACSGLDDEFFLAYNAHYAAVSPFRKAIDNLSEGELFSRVDSCGDAEFERTELYQGLFRKYDIYNFEFRALFRTRDALGGFGLTRPKTRPLFSADEARAIKIFVPHIRRAFQVYLNMSTDDRQSRLMADMLDKLPRGAVIVNGQRKVIFANNSGRLLIDGKDGLETDRNTTLRASSNLDTKKLWNLIDGIFDPVEGDHNFGGILLVSRPSSKRQLELLVSRFSTTTGGASERLAAIFIHDPEQRLETMDGLLAKLYGLTGAEAGVAYMLADGESLGAIGTSLGITQNTARTHLKRIFSKTDTRRQSELVKLILMGSATLRFRSRGRE